MKVVTKAKKDCHSLTKPSNNGRYARGYARGYERRIPEIQDEQRDGEGENPIAESLRPGGVLRPATLAVFHGPSSRAHIGSI